MRQGLLDLKNRALKQHAEDKGVVQDKIHAFEDGDVTKEAFASIVLEVLWKSEEADRDEETAMRLELLDLPNRLLKQRATDEGVSQDKIDKFDDGNFTKKQFVDPPASEPPVETVL